MASGWQENSIRKNNSIMLIAIPRYQICYYRLSSLQVDVQGTLYFWEPFDFDDIEDEGSVAMEEDDVVLDRIFNISIDDAEREDEDKNGSGFNHYIFRCRTYY